MRDRVFTVVAAYNEGKVVEEVVRSLLRVGGGEVVVVDDGSMDDTGERAFAGGATVITHPVNLGQGAALQTGIDYALRKGATHIVTFDADGQHSAAEVPPALEKLKANGAEVLLGSRFLGRAIGLPVLKRVVLRLGVVFTRLSTGLQVTDTHNGFRILTRAAAERIHLQQNGMSHASELLAQVAALGLTYVEFPVEVRYTAYSRGKGQPLSAAFHILVDSLVGRLLR